MTFASATSRSGKLIVFYRCFNFIINTINGTNNIFYSLPMPFMRHFLYWTRDHNLKVKEVRTEDNIAAIGAYIAYDPHLLFYDLRKKNLRKNFGLHTYKVQLVRQLKPDDHPRRCRFSDGALNRLQKDSEYHKKIIFSNEAYFWINRFVNKQKLSNLEWWTDAGYTVRSKKGRNLVWLTH